MLPSGCHQVAARWSLGDQSVTRRRVQNRSAAFDLAASIFDLYRSTVNARLGRCPAVDLPGTVRILVPRRSPAGRHAISLKSAGGRWETAREWVGHYSRSLAGRRLEKLPDFTQVLPKIDRRSTGNRQGTAQASLGLYSLLDFYRDRWAVPKFQRQSSRLQIDRSPL